MNDLKATLTELSERGTHIGAEELRQRIMVDLATTPEKAHTGRGWAVAAAVAVFVILVIGGTAILLGGSDTRIEPRDPPPATTTTAFSIIEETSTVPRVTTTVWHDAAVANLPAGAVAVEITDIAGVEGWRVGGVLFKGESGRNPDETALGGFSVAVDSDSFSTLQVLTDPSNEAEPWEFLEFPYVGDRVLIAEPGRYLLRVSLSNRLGPYSRWVPGCSDGVVLYEKEVLVDVDGGEVTRITMELDPAELWRAC